MSDWAGRAAWIVVCAGAWLSSSICVWGQDAGQAPRGTTAVAAKPEEAPAKFDLEAIDAYVAREVRRRGFPGLSLAIARGGKTALARGYGLCSIDGGAPVGPDTAFSVGSVTKQVICACALLLAEEGKLSVDDPVARYLPKLTRAHDISLYDLMTHGSGYHDFYPLDFVDRRLARPIAVGDLLAEYAGASLDFEPGARWSYSNTGYVVLGRAIERASGVPLQRFVPERILGPLEMAHSAFDPSADWKGNGGGRATGHTAFALGPVEPALPEAPGWLGAAGGLWASAPDLVRWDLALMEGRLLKPGSWRFMTTPRVLNDGRTTDYGCGMHMTRVEGETVFVHGGSISGFLAINALVPRTKSAVVLLTNAEHLDPAPLHRAILKLLIQDRPPPAPPKPPRVDGPSAKDAALDFFHQMASGQLRRERLAAEFSAFLNDDRVRLAAPRLKALGEPEKVEVTSVSERGGLEVASLRFHFKTAVLRGTLYRTPDGKIEQLLFRAE